MPGISDDGNNNGLGLIFSVNKKEIGTVKITQANTGISYQKGYVNITECDDNYNNSENKYIILNLGIADLHGSLVVVDPHWIDDGYKGKIDISSACLWSNIPAKNQFGIYARFA